MKVSIKLLFAAVKRVMAPKCHKISKLIAFGALLLGGALSTSAHPVPFSYVDITIEPYSIDLTLVVHIFDAAHELGVDPPELLFDPSVLRPQGNKLVALLQSRLQIAIDGWKL